MALVFAVSFVSFLLVQADVSSSLDLSKHSVKLFLHILCLRQAVDMRTRSVELTCCMRGELKDVGSVMKGKYT